MNKLLRFDGRVAVVTGAGGGRKNSSIASNRYDVVVLQDSDDATRFCSPREEPPLSVRARSGSRVEEQLHARTLVNDLGGDPHGSAPGSTRLADNVVQEIRNQGGSAVSNYGG